MLANATARERRSKLLTNHLPGRAAAIIPLAFAAPRYHEDAEPSADANGLSLSQKPELGYPYVYFFSTNGIFLAATSLASRIAISPPRF
jgi:hypothetical protein